MFQNLVNAYGSPSYKEINPAFFYLYHFPFTYSMMFGDVGHGLINGIIGLLMIVNEKKMSKIHNDMFELVFMGRYIIFLQSCFAIITGFLYNDFFALAFNCFGSKFKWGLSGGPGSGQFTANTTNGKSPVYYFGMDPYWHWSDNSMIFLNSYKMKLSVIVGVMQMIFGLIVKLINFCNAKKWDRIITVWIPEFFFMVSFFGYMVFCIVYKWM